MQNISSITNSGINSQIDAVLKTIREDARANGIPAETILSLYSAGRVAGQLTGLVPNVAYVLYHAKPGAPEHAEAAAQDETARVSVGAHYASMDLAEERAVAAPDQLHAARQENELLRGVLVQLAQNTVSISEMLIAELSKTNLSSLSNEALLNTSIPRAGA